MEARKIIPQGCRHRRSEYPALTMKHLVILLLLVVGGYFLWYYLNNREKVLATILLKRHTLAVLTLVGFVLLAVVLQTNLTSTKII